MATADQSRATAAQTNTIDSDELPNWVEEHPEGALLVQSWHTIETTVSTNLKCRINDALYESDDISEAEREHLMNDRTTEVKPSVLLTDDTKEWIAKKYASEDDFTNVTIDGDELAWDEVTFEMEGGNNVYERQRKPFYEIVKGASADTIRELVDDVDNPHKRTYGL